MKGRREEGRLPTVPYSTLPLPYDTLRYALVYPLSTVRLLYRTVQYTLGTLLCTFFTEMGTFGTLLYAFGTWMVEEGTMRDLEKIAALGEECVKRGLAVPQ
jgi:hypothetical protein